MIAQILNSRYINNNNQFLRKWKKNCKPITLEHISMDKGDGSSRKVFYLLYAQIKSWELFLYGSQEELCAILFPKKDIEGSNFDNWNNKTWKIEHRQTIWSWRRNDYCCHQMNGANNWTTINFCDDDHSQNQLQFK